MKKTVVKTVLETVFLGRQKSVCIKYKKDEKIIRVKVGVAYGLVEEQGIAQYCSKSEWRAYRDRNKTVDKKEDVEVIKKPIQKERLKGAKNIRAANKKKKD